MLSEVTQNVLFAKVVYKLTMYRPTATKAVIERVARSAVQKVCAHEDWAFDTLMNVTVSVAKQDLDDADGSRVSPL